MSDSDSLEAYRICRLRLEGEGRQPSLSISLMMKLRLHTVSILATIVATAIVVTGGGDLVVSAFCPIPLISHGLPPLSSSSHRMFTGIVEEMGSVVSLEERDDMVLWDGSKGKGTELVVQGNVVMEGAYLG